MYDVDELMLRREARFSQKVSKSKIDDGGLWSTHQSTTLQSRSIDGRRATWCAFLTTRVTPA